MTIASSTLGWRVPFAAIWLVAGLGCFFDAGFRADQALTIECGAQIERRFSAAAACPAADVNDGLQRFGVPRALLAQHAPLLALLGAALGVSGAAAVLNRGGERCGAAMLAVFLVLVTPVAHFPATPSGDFDPPQFFQVLKNLALLGACLLVWNVGCDEVHERREKKAAAKAAATKAAPAPAEANGKAHAQ